MNLKVEEWGKFKLSSLFDVSAGVYHYNDEFDEGGTNYISASNTNNGIEKKIDLKPEFNGNCIVTGKIGCTAFYQKDDFCATSDVNILRPKFDMNEKIGLFITTVINKSENYKWSYGRQCRVNDTNNIVIKLPIKRDVDGNPIIDEESNYNECGYVPDFEFMERYIESLHYKPISTGKKGYEETCFELNKWKPFRLTRLFDVCMGNGIDAISTTNKNPRYNYVSRIGSNNGVVGKVDEIEGEEVFPAGAMTLALGGSLGSCYLQDRPFYTAQNIGVLKERIPMSDCVKLFISVIITNECKIKYVTFGRELNTHFRNDFTIKLPVKYDGEQEINDESKMFSDEGYIPDWEWIEEYMTKFHYSDKI